MSYKTFDDLDFGEHKILPGKHATLYFANGWGVSVVVNSYSYGGENGLYELAVMVDGNLHYDNPVADGDVRGYLTPEEVTELMRQVQDFEPTNNARNRASALLLN